VSILRTSGELVEIARELDRLLDRFNGRRDVGWEDLGHLPYVPMIGSAKQESGHLINAFALSTETLALFWYNEDVVDSSLLETGVVNAHEVVVVAGIPDLDAGFVLEEGRKLGADSGVGVFFRHIGGDIDGVDEVVLEVETDRLGWGHRDGCRDGK
jgi:hypothetical protein